jgi:cobalamin biosynthesis Mg chelatase CobN
MNLEKRHLGAPRLGRYAALLVSVIALALVLFAVPAQAEECTSSSCVQYNPSLPSAEGGHTAKPHQQTPAKASKTGDGGGTSPSNPSGSGGSNEVDETGESESSPEKGGAVPGHDGGSGQGKPGGSANPGAEQTAQSPSQTASGKPASHSDDGGSSPLVPILIAIAVLAAISVAVVMIRQRRQRNSGGPSAAASPEAN